MNDTYNTRPFDHGGRARAGQTDFSANISPLGVPDAVRAVLADLAAGTGLPGTRTRTAANCARPSRPGKASRQNAFSAATARPTSSIGMRPR